MDHFVPFERPARKVSRTASPLAVSRMAKIRQERPRDRS